MSNPLVSTIIATRNRPELLRGAVASVIAQSYRPIEIVIVDENDPGSESRAATRRVVDEITELPVSYLDERSPGWVCRARNEGVSASNGTYIAFLDDDDEWKPEKIARQMVAATRESDPPGLVYTGLEVVDEHGALLKERRPKRRGRMLAALLRENVIGGPSSVLMPRAVFEEAGGFDPRFPTRHDLDLYIRVARSYPIEVVPEPLTVYLNQNPQAMSKNYRNKLEGRRLILEKHGALYEGRRDLMAAYHYGTALLCLKHKDRAGAREALWSSLRERPTPRALLRLGMLAVGRGAA
jgi:glycosyltransferase involved in cell wall biosynthesis